MLLLVPPVNSGLLVVWAVTPPPLVRMAQAAAAAISQRCLDLIWTEFLERQSRIVTARALTFSLPIVAETKSRLLLMAVSS
jgi:hypothetical protein